MVKVYKLDSDYADSVKIKSKEETKVPPGSLNSQAIPLNLAERLNCKGALLQGINTIGLMMRLELYVDERSWQAADKNTQLCMNQLITVCEDNIIDTLLHWNQQRSDVIASRLPPNRQVHKVIIPGHLLQS
jgi:hypothetical protein